MEKTFKEKFAERVKADDKLHTQILNKIAGSGEGLSVSMPIAGELIEHLQACIRAYDSCTKFDADGAPFDKARNYLDTLLTSD